MDCSLQGAKTPKRSAAWRLMRDNASHTSADDCNAHVLLLLFKILCAVCGEADWLTGD